MSVKEKLQQYIDIKGISVYRLEAEAGLSKGYWSKTKSISADVAMRISRIYTDISADWLLRNEGEMLKTAKEKSIKRQEQEETRPRIPYTAAAGSLANSLDGITLNQCEQIPVVRAFPNYDFTIVVKGDSMIPEYHSGDEVACLNIKNTKFIQWGRIHVLDTAQGIVIKRIYDSEGAILCKSEFSEKYPDFYIPKEEIYSVSLVVGMLRL